MMLAVAIHMNGRQSVITVIAPQLAAADAMPTSASRWLARACSSPDACRAARTAASSWVTRMPSSFAAVRRCRS